MDRYLTVKSLSEGIYKEKGSKFIGILQACGDVSSFQGHLESIKAAHHQARHFCYAYRFNPEEEELRANDDGEPSGTAGLPIYNQLKSKELWNVSLVVVRYYGGSKLGASGLARAYKEAAELSIGEAKIKEVEIRRQFRIQFDYKDTGIAMRTIQNLNLELEEQEMTEKHSITLSCLKSELDRCLQSFQAIHTIQILKEK